MSITVTEKQLKLVLDKLDLIRIELLKIRAMLLPEEELSEKEKKEIAEGLSISLEDLIKETKNSG